MDRRKTEALIGVLVGKGMRRSTYGKICLARPSALLWHDQSSRPPFCNLCLPHGQRNLTPLCGLFSQPQSIPVSNETMSGGLHRPNGVTQAKTLSKTSTKSNIGEWQYPYRATVFDSHHSLFGVRGESTHAFAT